MAGKSVLRLLKMSFGFLPRGCALWVADELGRLWYFADRKRRRIARASLASTPGIGRSHGEISRLARESFCHLGMDLAELLRMEEYTGQKSRGRLSVHGEGNVRNAYSPGKGVIYLTAHLGNRELLGTVLNTLGYPCVDVVPSQVKKRLDGIGGRIRKRGELMSVEEETAASRLIARLRGNRGVCIAIDETGAGEVIHVEFLGRCGRMSTLAAELALKTGATVVPTFLLMDRFRSYGVFFDEPLKVVNSGTWGTDIVATTISFSKAVERYVRLYPEQWDWTRRTWKPPANSNVQKAFREVERVLVEMPNKLGDVVMSLPAVECLRAFFPQAWIACLIKENIAEVVRGSNAVDGVMGDDDGSGGSALRRKVRTVRDVRRGFFDVVVLFTDSFESALWMYRAGVPLRVGYKAAGRGFLLTHAIRRKASPVHRIQYYLELCRALGKVDGEAVPRVRIAPHDKDWAEDFLRSIGVSGEEQVLGLCPGAVYGPAKRWPAGRFIDLAKRVSENYRAKFIVFGGTGDVEPCSIIAEELGETAINLCGKTTPRELASLLSECAVVISNDSGAMYLSAAVGTDVIGIFGSTNPEVTAPPENCTVIKKEVPCSPCFKRECPTDFRCMTSISVEEVYQRVSELLPSRAATRPGSKTTARKAWRSSR